MLSSKYIKTKTPKKLIETSVCLEIRTIKLPCKSCFIIECYMHKLNNSIMNLSFICTLYLLFRFTVCFLSFEN